MNKDSDKINSHDGAVRLKQLEELQSKLKNEHYSKTCFPSYIKPWNGIPLNFVKLNDCARTPTKANESDAGFDLYASHGAILERHTHKLIKTGIAMQIPKGYVGLIWPRSGMAYKHGIDVFAGVIDSGYRGDVGVILYNSQYSDYNVKKGDRIAQIIIQKVENFEFTEVSDLNKADRENNGFGSTGI